MSGHHVMPPSIPVRSSTPLPRKKGSLVQHVQHDEARNDEDDRDSERDEHGSDRTSRSRRPASSLSTSATSSSARSSPGPPVRVEGPAGHGVEIRLGTSVARITDDHGVLSDGAVIPTHCVIWGGGIKAGHLPDVSGGRASRRSRWRSGSIASSPLSSMCPPRWVAASCRMEAGDASPSRLRPGRLVSVLLDPGRRPRPRPRHAFDHSTSTTLPLGVSRHRIGARFF
jgi:hypothetical protein